MNDYKELQGEAQKFYDKTSSVASFTLYVVLGRVGDK